MLSRDFFVVAVLGIVSFLSSIELLAVGSIGRGALKRFLDYYHVRFYQVHIFIRFDTMTPK